MFMAQFSKTNWSREMTCYFGFFSPYVLQCVVQCRLVVWLTGWLAGSLGRMHICELFIWKSPCDMLLNTEYYISFSSCVVLSHLAVLSWIVADEKKKTNKPENGFLLLLLFICAPLHFSLLFSMLCLQFVCRTNT